jgi:lipopolysaccharide/colanic/teichoic acid biosynthesis glycosyltransferase
MHRDDAMNREIGLFALTNRAAVVNAATSPAIPSLSLETSSDRQLRVLDVTLAIILFVLIVPVMALIALAIRCTSTGPAIFAHERIGRGGCMFRCLKFRSMRRQADDHLTTLLASDPATEAEWARHHKLRRDPRVTRIGALLRKTSLDELPQLLNVLRGDMSLVGPRPVVSAEIPRYGRYIRHYCSVRPGITGLWQISGRNNVTYSRRVAMDVLYIRSRSLALNAYILARTVPCVLLADGTY